jgi:hypothetical protein
MKRSFLFGLGLLASGQVFAESKLPFEVNLKVDGGVWLVSWDQQSDAASRFGSDAIITNYKIDNALAQSLRFDLGLGGLNTHFEYAQANVSGDTAMTALSAGLGYTFDHFTMVTSYSKADFSGSMNGFSNVPDSYSSGTFTTDLLIADLLIFYKKLGFGLRHYEYEFPQDLYVVNKTSPNDIVVGTFGEIRYTGQFAVLAYDSDVDFNEGGNRWRTAFYGGYGRLKPTGEFIDQNNPTFKANFNNNQDMMADGDAWFVESQFGYIWQTQKFGFNWGAELGYRYNKLVASFPVKANYSLVSDFTTELSGPYFNLKGVF